LIGGVGAPDGGVAGQSVIGVKRGCGPRLLSPRHWVCENRDGSWRGEVSLGFLGGSVNRNPSEEKLEEMGSGFFRGFVLP
jgi:hypothetical protein